MTDLDALYRQEIKKRYPSIPLHAIDCLKRKKSNSKSNSLTKAIIDYINLSNLGFVFRVNTMGVKRKVEGKGEIYTPSTMTKGTADICGMLADGRFIAIEIKIGKDVQSEGQKIFQQRVKKMKGIYILATEFDQVKMALNNLLTPSNM